MTDYIFSVVYFLLCLCIIYPPTEFVTAGLTIKSIFSSLLGDEHEKFTTYHIKKSCLNLFIYSVLPLGYILSACFFETAEEVRNFFRDPKKSIEVVLQFTALFESQSGMWQILTTTSLIIPLLACFQIFEWMRDNCEKHPIAKNISKFCNNNMNWRAVANDMDAEFRRYVFMHLQ